MRYHHFFWDFDGTLYDTYGRVTRAFHKALRDMGIEKSEEDILFYAKKTLGEAAAWAAGKENVERVMEAYTHYAECEGSDTMRPYPGAEGLLRAIKENGGHHYLYTHRDMSAIQALERDGLWPLFTDRVIQEDGFPLKPSPQALNHLVQKHGLDLRLCCMVGDRSIDLQAGQNAGMDSILFDPDHFYRDYPITLRFEHFADMQHALVRP